MESEGTLLGPSWTQKLSSGLGDLSSHAGGRQTDTSPPSGIMGAHSSQGTLGLGSQISGDPSAPASPDPSSVLLLQQNLQRLYGSLGDLGQSASRNSLHSILEDHLDHPGANGGVEASGHVNYLKSDLRNTSEEDLFHMDQHHHVGGGSSSMPPQGGMPSISGMAGPNDASGLVGQLPGHTITESRTLYIRGIDPVMPDDVIREYLECFGDIHSLYTASKHRGYVMVTYHDIRAARLAQNTVHCQTWRGSQMACQFSAEGGSGSGGVTAALMLIALDGGSCLDDSYYMLSAYGELKELRREPIRPDVALAEFYDARHAAAALKSIGSSPEPGKRLVAIDAGPSVATLPPQLSEAAAPSASSWNNGNGGGMHQPLGSSGDINAMAQSLQDLMLGGNGGSNGSSSQQQQQRGQQQHQGRGMGLPERRAPGSASADLLGAMPMHSGPVYPLRGIQSTGSVALWAQQQAQQAHQQQQQQQQQQLGSSPLGQVGVWGNGGGGNNNGMQPDILAAQQHQQATAVALLQQNSALLQQQQHQVAQNAAVQAALQQAMLNQQVAAAAALGLQANRRGFSEPTLGGRLARRPMDPMAEAERRAQQERLYGLDMQRIAVGEDKRTTLMVKNIPNKYTQKMLLSLMEERFAGVVPFPFDFFYLPIDFKNRCNVGYAFINMTTPHAIPALVEEFHGRRWPKFNSEKVCKISYARIQGKNSLIQHFQNSSLLHEDKRCRPVLFGPNGEVEIFPIGDEV
jgi:RNA recognition motif 2